MFGRLLLRHAQMAGQISMKMSDSYAGTTERRYLPNFSAHTTQGKIY